MRCFYFASIALLLASSVALAADYSVTPTIDGTRFQTGFPFPTFSFNSNTAALNASFTQSASSGLQVRRSEYLFSLEFPLPALLPGEIVKSATLSWTEQSDFLQPGNQHPLFGYAGNGTLEAADFFGGTQLLPTVSNGANNGRDSFDVSLFVSGLVAGGNPYAGFGVQNAGFYQTQSGTFPFISTFTEVGTYQIAGRLDASLPNRPQLDIVIVPEVSTWVMMVISLCMFFSFGRLKRGHSGYL